MALPCLLLTISARILLSYEFLQFEYTRAGFPADAYGFSTDDRLQYGRHAIDFLFNKEPIEFLAEIRLPRDLCWQAADAEGCPLFNARELRHMQDVKQVARVAFALGAGCALLISGALALDRRAALVGLRTGARLALLLILALGVLSLAQWDMAFNLFHESFFAAGTWRFPLTDSLIRLYPEQLFVDAALAIGLMGGLGALCALAVCRWFEG